MVAKSSVIGIDLGACDSYVAYVGKNMVDVVQNEVSKRATPTLVGFTDRERLLGDAALSQIRSNAKNSCRNFKHLLGRKLGAKDIETEHFWSTAKLAEADDGFAGYEVTYKGESRILSASTITAMYLTKLREITEKWCGSKVADCVIAVPSSFADVQRQAVLDAAKIANLSVLRIMNEHTATALAYGIYRSNDFDKVKPMVVAFCSVGHTLFSVSIVQFIRGKLTVLCEKSDKVGGRDMDECLMREFASQFEKKHGCDPLSNKKAMFKLEDAVTKTKKILSANYEANLSVECLMDDKDFASAINRGDFEKMCQPMMERVQKVINDAKEACKLTEEEIDAVEIVGGASRVPWIKEMLSKSFGGKPLSTTMNQDESVARGCALQAAILSPLYKVRDFKVEDQSPYGVSISYERCASAAQPATNAEDATENPEDRAEENADDIKMGGIDGDMKSCVLFPPGSMMNTIKELTFFRKAPFDLAASYVDPSALPLGTPKELGTFHVDLPAFPEAKKVKVRTKLTLHGTFTVEGAQLLEDEEYEETVKEKRELPQEEASEEEDRNGEPIKVEVEASPAEESAPAKEGTSGTDDAAAAKDPGDGAAPMEPPSAPAEPRKEEDDTMGAVGEKPPAAAATEEAPPTNGEAHQAEKAPVGTASEQKEASETEKKEPLPKRPPKRKYEWVDVVKRKKRVKRTDIPVTSTGRPGLPDAVVQRKMDEETAMQVEMRDILETDERRNDLESYIFTYRNKIKSGEEYGPFISDADREKFSKELEQAEDWLYDNPESSKIQYIEKLAELKTTGDVVAWRCKEHEMRPEWIEALAGTLVNYRAATQNVERYGHIAAEKLAKVAAACEAQEKWLSDMKAKQEKCAKHEKPALICAEMERKNQELVKMADEILKEPKPRPPKPPKEEEQEQKPPPKEDDDAAEANGTVDKSPSPSRVGEANCADQMDVD